jgi:Tfp pilus assembly protein PilO
MKELFSNPQLRRQLMTRAVELIMLAAVAAAGWFSYGHVQAKRMAVASKEEQLAAEPQQLMAVSRVQGELRAREHDVARILAFVTHQNDIVGFIENIEEAAKKYDIALSVSSIDEVQEVDELGEPREPTGPFRSIRLLITGLGEASDLLEYMHTLEHEPRLLTVTEWDISADAAGAAAISQISAGRAIEEGVVTTAPAALAKLNAEIILLIHNEKYSP